MYEVSTGVMQNIKNEFVRELEDRDYSYTDHAINDILNEWYDQKQGLLSLLSKHPNWNSKRLMIHFDADFSRKLDTNGTYDFFCWLSNNHPSGNWNWNQCYNFMYDYCRTATYLSDDCDKEKTTLLGNSFNPLTEINELVPELHARVGQKKYKNCKQNMLPFWA